MTDPDRDFWLAQRDALLRQVDAIERLLAMKPRTAVLRDWYKRGILEARNEESPQGRAARLISVA